MRLLVVFAAVVAAVAAEVYFEERFEDGGTCKTYSLLGPLSVGCFERKS